MKRIVASYVAWYNRKYNRVGHLFRDGFKNEAVENDEYLLTVLLYSSKPTVSWIREKCSKL